MLYFITLIVRFLLFLDSLLRKQPFLVLLKSLFSWLCFALGVFNVDAGRLRAWIRLSLEHKTLMDSFRILALGDITKDLYDTFGCVGSLGLRHGSVVRLRHGSVAFTPRSRLCCVFVTVMLRTRHGYVVFTSRLCCVYVMGFNKRLHDAAMEVHTRIRVCVSV
jgi:hypothetical protein